MKKPTVIFNPLARKVVINGEISTDFRVNSTRQPSRIARAVVNPIARKQSRSAR